MFFMFFMIFMVNQSFPTCIIHGIGGGSWFAIEHSRLRILTNRFLVIDFSRDADPLPLLQCFGRIGNEHVTGIDTADDFYPSRLPFGAQRDRTPSGNESQKGSYRLPKH